MDELHDKRDDEDFLIMTDHLLTNYSDGFTFEVKEKTKYGFLFLGYQILSKFGSLLTRRTQELKGMRNLNIFIKNYCTTTVGK